MITVFKNQKTKTIFFSLFFADEGFIKAYKRENTTAIIQVICFIKEDLIFDRSPVQNMTDVLAIYRQIDRNLDLSKKHFYASS